MIFFQCMKLVGVLSIVLCHFIISDVWISIFRFNYLQFMKCYAQRPKKDTQPKAQAYSKFNHQLQAQVLYSVFYHLKQVYLWLLKITQIKTNRSENHWYTRDWLTNHRETFWDWCSIDLSFSIYRSTQVYRVRTELYLMS